MSKLFRTNYHVHLVKDFFILVASVVFAYILAKTGVIYWLVGKSQELRILGTVIAGVFFTSTAAVVPAGVALVEIAKTSSVFWTAFFGAIGSVAGDLLIFRFVRDSVSEDFEYLLGLLPEKRFKSILHNRMFRWLWPLLGAMVIASPLPDELGITLLGLSKMKYRYFVLASFALNFVGIFILGWVVR